MKKRILVTSTDVMMLQFLAPHVFNLQDNGYQVEVACSNVEGHIDELKEIFANKVKFNLVELSRSPAKLDNLKGLKQLRSIIKNGHYDIVWTNEPVMGVMTRLAARPYRKKGLRVLYIAHGFHFYNGAPKKNWMIFYPIEKVFSRFTDTIVTINQEDYQFAKRHFASTKIVKFPGIGINTSKFFAKVEKEDVAAKRKELGIQEGEKLYLSVGELETRKNHESSIKAFVEAGIDNAKLMICGVGSQKDQIMNLISSLGVEDRVRLLGYRYDIRELCHSADVFLFTTYQEGLSVALMEAMAVGMPCIVSKIRGNVDLIENGKGIYCDPHSVESIKKAIMEFDSGEKVFDESIAFNQRKVKDFDFETVKHLLISEINEL